MSTVDALNTEPANFEPGDIASSWQVFRIDSPARRDALLRRLLTAGATVSVADGTLPLFGLPVWSIDLPRNLISLRAEPRHQDSLQGILWAVCYLDQCKIQFQLLHPQWHQANDMRLLKAALPGAVFALHRRGRIRKRIAAHIAAPVVHVPLPPTYSHSTEMVVVNIDDRGCGLWKPAVALPFKAGMALTGVEVQLDHEHILVTSMSVQHVSHHNEGEAGTMIGCLWQRMHPDADAMLDRWLTRIEHRTGTLADLNFD